MRARCADRSFMLQIDDRTDDSRTGAVTCTSGAWKLYASRSYVYVLGYDTEHHCI